MVKFAKLLMLVGSCFLTSCSLTTTGTVGDGKKFSVSELEFLEGTYYKEFNSNEKLTNNYKDPLRTTQCVMRAVTREVSGAFSSLRTEWNVDLLRSCNLNISLIGNGTLVASNCVPTLVSNQDELAYLVAHALAHLLLEHDNYRISNLIGDKAQEEGFDLKTYLRNKDGYNAFTRALGLLDEAGNVTPYTDEEELAADTIALKIMSKAGFNPSASLVLWQNMKNSPALRAEGYIRLHPHSDEKLKQLSEQIPLFTPDLTRARTEFGRKPTCM